MSMEPLHLFIVFLATGLILVGGEIFVPGGVLGVIGGLALIGACITGFTAFPGYGGAVTLGIIAMMGVAIVLWIRLFPTSFAGRRMTVTQDLHDAKATDDWLPSLKGKTGVTSSKLRPGGYATIEDKRIDVISQGGMIAKNEHIVVVEVEGNRVVVRKAEPPATS
jgi:membrane-bound serine protease (ClpP class)